MDGNFFDSEGRFALNLFEVVASRLERKRMSVLHASFPRGCNLPGKSNNRCSPTVLEAFAMLWRKGSKPSVAHPSNKVCVPVNLLPDVVVSLPPPTLPVFEEIGAPLMMCNRIKMGSLTFLLPEFLAPEIAKEGQFSLLFLCLQANCRNPTLAKCRGEAQHFQSWGFGVPRDSRMFKARQQGSKHLALRFSWRHWKGLEV